MLFVKSFSGGQQEMDGNPRASSSFLSSGVLTVLLSQSNFHFTKLLYLISSHSITYKIPGKGGYYCYSKLGETEGNRG